MPSVSSMELGHGVCELYWCWPWVLWCEDISVSCTHVPWSLDVPPLGLCPGLRPAGAREQSEFLAQHRGKDTQVNPPRSAPLKPPCRVARSTWVSGSAALSGLLSIKQGLTWFLKLPLNDEYWLFLYFSISAFPAFRAHRDVWYVLLAWSVYNPTFIRLLTLLLLLLGF